MTNGWQDKKIKYKKVNKPCLMWGFLLTKINGNNG